MHQPLSDYKRELAAVLLKKRGISLAKRNGIARSPAGDTFFLSPVQLGLWFHEQLHPGTALYNTPVVAEILGEIDPIKLERAFNRVIERHEILHSVFRLIDDEPKQVRLQFGYQKLQICDLTAMPEEQIQQAAQELSEHEVRQVVNLTNGPVFHGKILKLAADRWWLVVVCHHIVFDGVSRPLFLRELSECYEVEMGSREPLPELEIQYSDFAQWQRSPDTEAMLQETLAWWVKKQEGAPTYLALPSDRPRPPVQAFKGNTCTFSLDAQTVGRLRGFAKKHSVTEFSILTAALYIVLYRLTEQSDIVICSGVAARQPREIENLLGCFINIVLLRAKCDTSSSITDFVRYVGEVCIDAFSHQEIPFEKLVRALAPERDLSYNPLAQVMIVYHNEDIALPNIGGCAVRQVPTERLIAQYDLLLRLTPRDNDISGRLEYSEDLFDASTVQRYVEQYKYVVHQILDGDSKTIGSIYTLPQDQVFELLKFNPASTNYPSGITVQGLIEHNVAKQPNAAAIKTLNEDVSYLELNERANQLAHCLLNKGVKRGDIVAVSLERSVEMVVALLATIKAGAGYLPIDPNYPSDRVKYLAVDSKAKIVITHSLLKSKFEVREIKINKLLIDTENWRDNLEKDNIKTESTPNDLFYLIYTSGSTGAPKGVMLDQRGRINNFYDFNSRFAVGPEDRLLAVASLSFDMCAYDVFGTLMAGGTIVLACNGAAPDPDEWAALIEKHHVTIWHSPPALLDRLLDAFGRKEIDAAPSLRLVLLGGDWIPLPMPDQVRQYGAKDLTVVSMGGATEVSMDSTIFIVDKLDPHWSSIPYGVAMANQSAFVLDNDMRLAPVGVAGELYLGGEGVGWGYLRRPAMTATRFLPNPYSERMGERMYRTGDIARWTNKGHLELLGRADFQVKVNGVRIELGEIDSVLSTRPGIRACVTHLHREKDVPPVLVSYIVPDTDDFNFEQVRHALYDRLPAYMVPRQHVILPELPLSPNGKILRTALPVPAKEANEAIDVVAPKSIMERTLYEIWSAALNMSGFGIDHDFFDLGGTSLQAALVVNRLPKRLSVIEFMRNTTIRSQAKLLTSDKRTSDGRVFRFPLKESSKTTLLCAPYAGGSPIIFRQLASLQPAGVSTAVICMPSPSECAERKLTLEAIATQVIDDLTEKEVEDIILYGHCAGTAITAEVARQLEIRGHRPKKVILAAAMPPGVASPYVMPRESAQEIVDFVASLGGTEETLDSEDWAVMVKEFQRDSKLVRAHYSSLLQKPRVQLDAPLIVVIASDDPLTSGHENHIQAWHEVANKFSITSITGGHYFVSTSVVDVARIINDDIATQYALKINPRLNF